MSVLAAAPIPGTSVEMSSGASDGLTIYAIAICGLISMFGFYNLIRDRSPLVIACLAGGLLCVPIEPRWDVIGYLHFSDGIHRAFTMFEQLDYPVHYPWWAVLVYVQFSGISAYIFFRMFQSGVQGQAFWLFIMAQFAMNIVVEVIYINLDAYQYYGDQPLRLLDITIWSIFADRRTARRRNALPAVLPLRHSRGSARFRRRGPGRLRCLGAVGRLARLRDPQHGRPDPRHHGGARHGHDLTRNHLADPGMADSSGHR